MSKFGDAPIKGEGAAVQFDMGDLNVSFPVRYEHLYENEIETNYVERRIPVGLEEEANTLIDNWLKSKGFDPEEI